MLVVSIVVVRRRVMNGLTLYPLLTRARDEQRCVIDTRRSSDCNPVIFIVVLSTIISGLVFLVLVVLSIGVFTPIVWAPMLFALLVLAAFFLAVFDRFGKYRISLMQKCGNWNASAAEHRRCPLDSVANLR